MSELQSLLNPTHRVGSGSLQGSLTHWMSLMKYVVNATLSFPRGLNFQLWYPACLSHGSLSFQVWLFSVKGEGGKDSNEIDLPASNGMGRSHNNLREAAVSLVAHEVFLSHCQTAQLALAHAAKGLHWLT